eukprot:CAMPEP_0202864746 /NCGR_PEP_ID=MMETSP1391-20130828/4860_1 /ASSEMBLY_ACC=CAM_ASM_000867 /TAXON_ID=1034604 /ORGANISM="Chlamydomonas leiostraca, Strain SAG 11-49" /LENGTH=131 /DNA_ID=CAMNT_0049544515 /DNA_START=15 /DNA_END=410 /DNA_ORIENTATION=-
MRKAYGTGRPYTAPTTVTTTLNANHTQEFKMNSLISREYETVPLQAGHIPGTTVHVPAGSEVVGQRRAQATLHNQELRPLLTATKGQWADMQLTDLRPQERAYNKNYCYAENTYSCFLRFPGPKQFDHRKL